MDMYAAKPCHYLSLDAEWNNNWSKDYHCECMLVAIGSQTNDTRWMLDYWRRLPICRNEKRDVHSRSMLLLHLRLPFDIYDSWCLPINLHGSRPLRDS